MTRETLRFVFLGLSITSAWGNGHATTFRALTSALSRLGHEVTFLERDVPWYAENRDEPQPSDVALGLYRDLAQLDREHRSTLREADAVIVGSYVPEGRRVARWALRHARGPVLFYDIDTPVTLEALEARRCEYLDPELVRAFDAYLSFTGGPLLARLEGVYGARRARPLYCSVDPERHAPHDGSEPEGDLGYMGTSTPDREAAFWRLFLEPARRLAQARFSLAGSGYDEAGAWPQNVVRLGHVRPRDHGAFYTGHRFTLNLTRRQMVAVGHSPSVRLFEAAACGATILSDPWPGIEEVLTPGREVLVTGTTDDVVEVLEGMAETQRRAIGRRARERVLAEHTSGHRALELVGHVEQAHARRRSPHA